MNVQILTKIIERAGQIWGVDSSKLSADTTFAEMNPKSVHYSQMTTFLEDAFDIEIPYMNFKRCITFGDAADYIDGLLSE
jgi:acyl carrier protein